MPVNKQAQRSHEIALMGILLIACGIASLAGGPGIHGRLIGTTVSWVGAVLCLVRAHAAAQRHP